ncbi:uncharacterized protein LOC133795853 [Humulus lupulus]|uniref:uncharacterized protein LOC133795853 n=1 Tax=Humulus lupulus TaxID=3486 RepID=UPI002B409220|nr:uncharacterized protein LOC133795853 [Humulus lupulus]
MNFGEAFNLYSNPKAKTPASRRKESKRYPGESSSDPSKKRARTEDPPTHVPSKESTLPPAPVDPTPPDPFDPIPPALVNPTPPDQSRKTQAEAVLNTAYNSTNDKLKKLSRHQCRVLTLSTGWRCSEETSAKHAEEIKAVKGRLAEQLKAVEDRHAQLGEELRVVEERNAKLGEELKQHKEALAKVTESKAKYKEASVINFKEASKIQDELAISKKETAELEERVKLLEETNAGDLERFKETTLKCFYMYWKSSPKANYDYLPEHMK